VTPDPITIDIIADKRLVDKTLTAGEFSFQLQETEVQPQVWILAAKQPQVVTNAADGSIVFQLTFSEEGRHYYTISEIAGDERLYEFDKTIYPVIVNVELVDGVLLAELNYPEGEAIFSNKYKKPATEPTPTPTVAPTQPPTEDPTPTPTPTPTPEVIIDIEDEEVPEGEIELDDEQVPEGSLPKTGGYPALFYYGLGFTLTGIGLRLRRKTK
jgi:pilin isopeptide linkage protein